MSDGTSSSSSSGTSARGGASSSAATSSTIENACKTQAEPVELWHLYYSLLRQLCDDFVATTHQESTTPSGRSVRAQQIYDALVRNPLPDTFLIVPEHESDHTTPRDSSPPSTAVESKSTPKESLWSAPPWYTGSAASSSKDEEKKEQERKGKEGHAAEKDGDAMGSTSIVTRLLATCKQAIQAAGKQCSGILLCCHPAYPGCTDPNIDYALVRFRSSTMEFVSTTPYYADLSDLCKQLPVAPISLSCTTTFSALSASPVDMPAPASSSMSSPSPAASMSSAGSAGSASPVPSMSPASSPQLGSVFGCNEGCIVYIRCEDPEIRRAFNVLHGTRLSLFGGVVSRMSPDQQGHACALLLRSAQRASVGQMVYVAPSPGSSFCDTLVIGIKEACRILRETLDSLSEALLAHLHPSLACLVRRHGGPDPSHPAEFGDMYKQFIRDRIHQLLWSQAYVAAPSEIDVQEMIASKIARESVSESFFGETRKNAREPRQPFYFGGGRPASSTGTSAPAPLSASHAPPALLPSKPSLADKLVFLECAFLILLSGARCDVPVIEWSRDMDVTSMRPHVRDFLEAHLKHSLSWLGVIESHYLQTHLAEYANDMIRDIVHDATPSTATTATPPTKITLVDWIAFVESIVKSCTRMVIAKVSGHVSEMLLQERGSDHDHKRVVVAAGGGFLVRAVRDEILQDLKKIQREANDRIPKTVTAVFRRRFATGSPSDFRTGGCMSGTEDLTTIECRQLIDQMASLLGSELFVPIHRLFELKQLGNEQWSGRHRDHVFQLKEQLSKFIA